MIVLLSMLACGPGHQDQPKTEGDPKTGAGKSEGQVMLQNRGSDTMVNVAQAWAEEYRKVRPNVAIAVSGGGSGTGIAALVNGTVDLANSSRELKPEEKENIKAKTQKEAVEHVVAYDALAIYVHKDNPLQKITKAQLAAIYGEGGAVNTWADMGVTVPGCSDGSIVRISRQNNSGTYEFFREWTLGKGDFKLGSRDMQGSKEVVDAVTSTPCSIGYSGMGYHTADLRWLPVALDDAATAIEPSIDTVHNNSYPISRPLFITTAGEVTGEAGRYLQWVQSDAGQAIVERTGYVTLPAAERKPAPAP